MPKRKKAGNFYFKLALIIAAFLITALCTLTSEYNRDGESLKVGGVALRRYKAPRKIEDEAATRRNREEAAKAAAEMKPIYKKDPAADESVMKNTADLFVKIDDIRAVYQDELARQAEAERAAEAGGRAAFPSTPAPLPPGAAYSSGTGFRNGGAINAGIATPMSATPAGYENSSGLTGPLMPLTAMEQLDQLSLTISDAQSRLLLNMDDEHYNILKNAARKSLQTVLEQGVQQVDAKSLLSIQDELSKIDMTNEMRNIAYQIASSLIRPNYVIDAETTLAARQDIASKYTTVYVLKDQTIVDDGQIISSEIYALLDSLGMVSDGFQNNILPIAGAIALEAIFFALAYTYIKTFCSKLFKTKKEAALLFFIFSATTIAVRLLVNIPYQFLPILLFTMLVAMLIDLRLSIVLNFLISVTAMFICKGGVEFIVFYTVTGLAVSVLSKFTTERNQVFIVGILSCVASFALMFLILFVFERGYSQNILVESGYAAGNGIFTVIICLGSLPFWETFFGVITNIKLLDLINPNNALLRRLIIEAPGTYHHSLVVANLSETAAYEIGADANLARVGGYYHDIGKLKNPQFFTENQDLMVVNPHNALTPLESVSIIIGHVSYGMDLAKDFKLPQAVADFIIQHHGTTLIQYFYCEAYKKSVNIDKNDFRYPFIIPQSKETAILMLADAAEAAVRSMRKGMKDYREIESDLKNIIKAKLDDGQLLDSGLSIKDLDLIAKAFMRVFKGMFHERIEYPKLEQLDEPSPAQGEVSTA